MNFTLNLFSNFLSQIEVMMFIRKRLIWFRKSFCFSFESKTENSIKGLKKIEN